MSCCHDKSSLRLSPALVIATAFAIWSDVQHSPEPGRWLLTPPAVGALCAELLLSAVDRGWPATPFTLRNTLKEVALLVLFFVGAWLVFRALRASYAFPIELKWVVLGALVRLWIAASERAKERW